MDPGHDQRIMQAQTPEIEITLRQRSDGSVVMRIVRADGSTTWQTHEGRRAAFFPLHDLAHFAVETTLGAMAGFYGLLAAGWDLEDFESKDSRRSLPAEAAIVEHLVGLLDLERSGGAAPFTAAEVRDQLAMQVSQGTLSYAPPVTDAQLDEVRLSIAALHAMWATHASVGAPLVLRFKPPTESGLSEVRHTRGTESA